MSVKGVPCYACIAQRNASPRMAVLWILGMILVGTNPVDFCIETLCKRCRKGMERWIAGELETLEAIDEMREDDEGSEEVGADG